MNDRLRILNKDDITRVIRYELTKGYNRRLNSFFGISKYYEYYTRIFVDFQEDFDIAYDFRYLLTSLDINIEDYYIENDTTIIDVYGNIDIFDTDFNRTIDFIKDSIYGMFSFYGENIKIGFIDIELI